MVGIQQTSLRQPFKWPESIPLVYATKDLLTRDRGVDDHSRLPTSRLARGNVKHAYFTLRDKGIDARRAAVFIDIGASPRLRSVGVGKLPTLTATRAKSFGWWISICGRKLSLKEYYNGG